jgi:hypothetical protein
VELIGSPAAATRGGDELQRAAKNCDETVGDHGQACMEKNRSIDLP